ncbi:MAG: hypothetical protein LBS30_06680 [Planctomycetota bacterium]|jgi:hypothetical protein|nr:hypothetical protein [Planctomycetota bacterium]
MTNTLPSGQKTKKWAAFALTFALFACGAVNAQDGIPLSEADLNPNETAVVPAFPHAGTTIIDPLIYNEDGSLYTGPMPDGSYVVNGVVTPPGASAGTIVQGGGATVYDPGAVYTHPEIQSRVVIVEPSPLYRLYNPYSERYRPPNVFYPWSSRWDLYRYRPDRRPPPSRRWNRPRPDRPYRDHP